MTEFRIARATGGGPECRVEIGAGTVRASLATLLQRRRPSLTIVVADTTVHDLHGRSLARSARERGFHVETATFPPGEAHKTRETKAALEDRFAELGVDRDSLVVALGGGVTGDLAGFTAATWHRGVPLVLVPSTLLAMVDAAIGGKTAVNHPAGKNLIGAFHLPLAVWIDVDLLDTLPAREFRQGAAEMVKVAAVADEPLFERLEGALPGIERASAEVRLPLVSRCARAKADIVAADFEDRGLRAVLNFGHTVGHALEAASGYRVTHGDAVSIGMAVEARLAREVTGLAEEDLRRIERLLDSCGLPTRIPDGVEADDLVARTSADKKSGGGTIRCALPSRLGRVDAAQGPTRAVSRAALRDAVAASRG